MAEPAKKRAKLSLPPNDVPVSKWIRPKPRKPSGSELPPIRFALLMSKAYEESTRKVFEKWQPVEGCHYLGH